MSDEIVKPSPVADMFKAKKWGIGAQKERAKEALKDLDPLTCEHRIGIIFDDSGSMNERVEEKTKIDHAHTGIRNFTSQCNPRDTSLAIYPLNKEPQVLSCNYDLVNLYCSTIRPTGSTPLYGRTIKMLSDLELTRGVLFSDGEPTDGSGYYSATDEESEEKEDIKDQMIVLAIEKKVPLDTIFIGDLGTRGFKLMKEIADKTGGIFVHFKDAKKLLLERNLLV